MANPVTIWTYDWVPEMPRGHVRDIRLRWALEEAGLPYRVATVPVAERGPDHLARQPFAQVPFLEDDGIRVFESGACLIHLAEKSEFLMPRDPQLRSDTLQWIVAALNSMEMVTVPWWYIQTKGVADNPMAGWMRKRFERLDTVVADRDWLVGNRFTAADILMADVLRIPAKHKQLDDFPALTAYLGRACDRPAFRKALQDQLDHFEAADRKRNKADA